MFYFQKRNNNLCILEGRKRFQDVLMLNLVMNIVYKSAILRKYNALIHTICWTAPTVATILTFYFGDIKAQIDNVCLPTKYNEFIFIPLGVILLCTNIAVMTLAYEIVTLMYRTARSLVVVKRAKAARAQAELETTRRESGQGNENSGMGTLHTTVDIPSNPNGHANGTLNPSQQMRNVFQGFQDARTQKGRQKLLTLWKTFEIMLPFLLHLGLYFGCLGTYFALWYRRVVSEKFPSKSTLSDWFACMNSNNNNTTVCSPIVAPELPNLWFLAFTTISESSLGFYVAIFILSPKQFRTDFVQFTKKLVSRGATMQGRGS
ncbi:hypothetical protein HK102_007741 [Quaeritorhiza haematococci]|nr:hypothetical protein HK102_007741 [Quaeritorhiza haematococci]